MHCLFTCNPKVLLTVQFYLAHLVAQTIQGFDLGLRFVCTPIVVVHEKTDIHGTGAGVKHFLGCALQSQNQLHFAIQMVSQEDMLLFHLQGHGGHRACG
jgi:hypothetical protein|mmetsp:Transcript_104821/g.177108  ORF Transcript_104821/g.177108 Transcript_104821/m.177108 type:complete len:99 (-) Transcript_104821:110-406(-)